MKCMEVWGGSCASDACLRRPGLDIWIQSNDVQCASEGGGDVHLLSSCASGRITRMLLADICGIGPLFSEIAGEIRDLMKRNVNAIQQQRIVREICSRLEEAAHKGGYASMLISTYFAPTRSYSLCNTGHPPPLVYRKTDSAWSVLKTQPNSADTATKVDMVTPDEYQHIKTKLDVGDIVLSYSNVLTECRDQEGNTLGHQGVLDRVRTLDLNQPEDLASALVSLIRGDHVDNVNADEATVLVCRATETKVAMRDNVLAPFRLLGTVSDNTSIE